MDARFRGLFLASAGFIFATVGFTLSVLSTFLRLLLPYHPTRGAAVASTIRRRSTIRKFAHSKHRRSHVPTPNSDISSAASTSTSLESNVSETKANAPSRVVSEPTTDDRPDFRNMVARRHRRSDSAPPSPAPWASSHSDAVDVSTHACVDDTALHRGGKLSTERRPSLVFHLPRNSTFDSASSPEDEHGVKRLSFLHRRKVRKTSSVTGGLLTAEPLPLAEKRKSQLFAPLLHRRHSQNIDNLDVTQVSVSGSTEEEGHSSPERPHSQDMARVLPKRSQTLRTQPYEAPYFFPPPGTVAADTYLPPRRKPSRSKTLSSPDET
ncbi:hypothetical protein K438DRAFT_562682 [Mycena galopus ATCC 62051]|nr:hypothetical protein K438DRAFT_562682 [Mycena galopus ATCC 62051]